MCAGYGDDRADEESDGETHGMAARVSVGRVDWVEDWALTGVVCEELCLLVLELECWVLLNTWHRLPTLLYYTEHPFVLSSAQNLHMPRSELRKSLPVLCHAVHGLRPAAASLLTVPLHRFPNIQDHHISFGTSLRGPITGRIATQEMDLQGTDGGLNSYLVQTAVVPPKATDLCAHR